MKKKNSVFIATSMDGYIADKSGGIEWLNAIPNPNSIDMGYSEFTSNVDAIVMGRTTFETICNFDIDWPYSMPVFVLSNTLTKVPKEYQGKVQLVKGVLSEVLQHINHQGYHRLYIDGGKTVQNFLKEDLIDEMIITIIPILLGGGSPLFSVHPKTMNFECIKTKLYLNKVVQNHYKRCRD